MNRAELIQDVAGKAGVDPAQATAVLDALAQSIAAVVAGGGEVRIPGFLTAQRVSRPARTGRNPRTGESMEIPAKFVVKLTPGTTLKNAV
ncbi:integration host factor [Nakamurella sp. YIM 132087]|uniref:Integration host factor n=1 Tax=Nakamurella alba TaxID=2665158 RepID=A0A7K1FU69_9ACTN|nr:HU family DNA-binding protein [Nakamurella alba]MTD16733.1 integration host factor [Nakamurella alba]